MASSIWLGFSLSPHKAMEAPSSSAPGPAHPAASATMSSANTSTTCNFLFSPPVEMAAPSPGYYYVGDAYGDGTSAAGVYYSHSHLPAFCNMEGMMASSSPKLEDFLGGGNGGGHDTATYYSHQEEQDEEAGRSYQYQQQHQHLVPYNFQPMTEAEMLQEAAAPMEEAMAAAKNFLVTSYGACYSNVEMQPLSLSMMSPAGSQSSSCVVSAALQQHQMAAVAAAASATAAQGRSNGGGEGQCVGRKRGTGKGGHKQPVHRKSIDTFGQRTSQYRGVTSGTGGPGDMKPTSGTTVAKRMGRQGKDGKVLGFITTEMGLPAVYLGGYDTEDKAARAYDLAALKYWGSATHINFPIENYQLELEEMKSMTRLEFVAHLRRRSSGFSRGASIYRGVTRHHQHGRWQARIGRVVGNKDLYLGTYNTQEEAAEAYDIAAIKFRGLTAVTNFDISRYDVDKIMESNLLLPVSEVRKVSGNVSVMQKGRELVPADAATAPGNDWRIVPHESPQEAMPGTGPAADLEKGVMGDPHSLHGVVGLDAACAAHGELDDPGKTGGVNISNSSSLVTSLGTSREGSPERLNLAMIYAKQQNAVGEAAMSPWMPMPAPTTALHVLRTPSTVSQIPVFAAWADA
ncbi:hypothetical protein ACP4OV_015445 [Aristida adscensionis]